MDMSDNYRDKTFMLMDEIAEAYAAGNLTKDEARELLGLALQRDANELIRDDMRELIGKSKKQYKRAIFMNYTNETLSYG